MFTITHKNITSESARCSHAYCHYVKFVSNECPCGRLEGAVIDLRIGVLVRLARGELFLELSWKRRECARQGCVTSGLSNSVCFLTLCDS